MSRGKRKPTERATFRSGLESMVAGHLDAALLEWSHESEKLKYAVPARTGTYLPDFKLKKYPKLILEAKGIFSAADRKKMILIKEQFPEREILMIFGRAHNTLSKKSKTTYADWCDKHGIRWVDIKTFIQDPTKCLSRITKRKTSGKSPTSLQKKQRRSSKSARTKSSITSPMSMLRRG